jgi:hypothetical protein
LQAQSNAQATAESLARAYAQAITVSCSGEVAQVEREEISRVLAQAITSAEAAVTQQGAGSTEAAARAVAEDIQVAVAKSVAAAVGKCKCDAEGRPTDEEARAIVGTAAGSEGQQTTDTQARTDVQGELDDFFAGTGTSQAEAQTGRRWSVILSPDHFGRRMLPWCLQVAYWKATLCTDCIIYCFSPRLIKKFMFATFTLPTLQKYFCLGVLCVHHFWVRYLHHFQLSAPFSVSMFGKISFLSTSLPFPLHFCILVALVGTRTFQTPMPNGVAKVLR